MMYDLLPNFRTVRKESILTQQKGPIRKIIEPFPFGSPLGHHMMSYMQGVWIKALDNPDSLAILFEYSLSNGDDIRKKIIKDKIYHFRLKEYQIKNTQREEMPHLQVSDSTLKFLDSLPVTVIVDTNTLIKSIKYWIVVEFEEL